MNRSSPSSSPCSPLPRVHAHKLGLGPSVAKCRISSPSASRFRDARIALRWTQDETASRWGVTRRTLISWETGSSALPADALIWIEGEAARKVGT